MVARHPVAVVMAALAALLLACVAPLVGFLKSPSFPVALLDIHGTQDGIIPANASGPIPAQAGVGPGPHGSVVSNDGFFYTTQPGIILSK